MDKKTILEALNDNKPDFLCSNIIVYSPNSDIWRIGYLVTLENGLQLSDSRFLPQSKIDDSVIDLANEAARIISKAISKAAKEAERSIEK